MNADINGSIFFLKVKHIKTVYLRKISFKNKTKIIYKFSSKNNFRMGASFLAHRIKIKIYDTLNCFVK